MNAEKLLRVKVSELEKTSDKVCNSTLPTVVIGISYAACIISETLGNRLDELNRNISEMNRLMQEQLK